MTIFLSRACYDQVILGSADGALPLKTYEAENARCCERRELYLSAERRWVVGGVFATFKTEEEAARFQSLLG